MPKPTHASVTEVPCTCGYLENAAANPDLPIGFDARVNEFFFRYGPVADEIGESKLNIYHCPFCGGTAPESQRDSLFAVVPAQELDRIAELFGGLTSLEEVIARIGSPDHDMPRGRTKTWPEKEGQPPRVEYSRTLIYSDLSEVANVRVSERFAKGIDVVLNGKEIKATKDG